ncbi:MAG: tetratricopeptide repeat protein [Treponema sp.]|nr:tetratricopeptide repeat protein [Treponema sp.]
MRRLLFISIVAVSFLFTGCIKSNKTIIRMQKLEENVQKSPTTIEELKAAIAKYQNRVADIQLANGQIGIWYKILGTRYLDNKMYGEALHAFQKALEFYPENQNLYYYVGVCAGWMSKASLDFEATGSQTKKRNYLLLAESAYKQAIQLEPKYVRALLGLSILYVNEFHTSDKAIPLLELVLSVDKKNIDAMFLLAGAYYATGMFDESVAMYDTLIATSKSDANKKIAEENKRAVLNAAYAK